MKLLLDTHAFLWYITNDPRLPRHAYDAIRDKSNQVYLSVVSVWEALVKYQIGKLPLPSPADEYIANRQTAHRSASLPLDVAGVSRLVTLPLHHRDPFGSNASPMIGAQHHLPSLSGTKAPAADRVTSGQASPLVSLSIPAQLGRRLTLV